MNQAMRGLAGRTFLTDSEPLIINATLGKFAFKKLKI